MAAALLIPVVSLVALDCSFSLPGPLVHGTITGTMPFGKGEATDNQTVVTLDSGLIVMLANVEYRPGAAVLLRLHRLPILRRKGYAFERFE